MHALFLHPCSLFGIVGVTDACLEALSKSCSSSLTTLDVNGCIGIEVRISEVTVTTNLTIDCNSQVTTLCFPWCYLMMCVSEVLVLKIFFMLSFFFYLDMFDRGGAGMTCWSCSHHWVASKCTASSHHGSRRLCILHLGRGREVFRCVFWRQVPVFILFCTTMYVCILLRAREVLQKPNLWKRLTDLSWQSEASLLP